MEKMHTMYCSLGVLLSVNSLVKSHREKIIENLKDEGTWSEDLEKTLTLKWQETDQLEVRDDRVKWSKISKSRLQRSMERKTLEALARWFKLNGYEYSFMNQRSKHTNMDCLVVHNGSYAMALTQLENEGRLMSEGIYLELIWRTKPKGQTEKSFKDTMSDLDKAIRANKRVKWIFLTANGTGNHIRLPYNTHEDYINIYDSKELIEIYESIGYEYDGGTQAMMSKIIV